MFRKTFDITFKLIALIEAVNDFIHLGKTRTNKVMVETNAVKNLQYLSCRHLLNNLYNFSFAITFFL